MRRLIVFALLLIFSPGVFTAQPAGRALVSVENPAPGTTATLLGAAITVVADMKSYLLLVATPGDLERLDALGLDWRILDNSIEGRTYYTAIVRGDDVHDRIRTKVRILRYDGYSAVIEAPVERAERIAGDGADIARVFLYPVRLPPGRKPDRQIADQPDPIIEDLVGRVSTGAIDSTVLRLQNFVTRHSAHDSCLAAARHIKARFESYGIDSVYFHDWDAGYNDNVVAVIPGVGDSGEMVVIGGHYDSVTGDPENCPGADDNASGTAGVLECARVLANSQFENTIVFIAFCGEEQGLLGSAAYAKEARQRGDDIIAMINMDMIGYLAPGDSLDLDLVDGPPWLRDLAMDVGAIYVPELSVVDGNLPSGSSSDHRTFWQNGFASMLLFEDWGDWSPYLHTANDVVGTSYVSSLLAEQTVKLATALVAALAEPFRVTIRHTPPERCPDPSEPCRLAAEVLTSSTVASIVVHYSIDGVNDSVPLVHTGNGDWYEADIPPQPLGHATDYYIVAETREGYRSQHPKRAPVERHRFVTGSPRIVAEDDFETDGGWTVGDVDDDASTGVWIRVDPFATTYQYEQVQPEDDHTPDPGVMCFVTGSSQILAHQTTNDVDLGKTTLFSPFFDLSDYANAWVGYYRWYTNDTGGDTPTDEWVVDVSADSGRTWARLETLATSHREWQPVEVYLSDVIPLASAVQFRFIASDYDAGSIVEAAVDDFSIKTYVDSTALISGSNLPPGYLGLSQNFPNPFNPETRIRVEVGGSGARVTLRIYDVAGRVVKTLVDNEFVAGERIVRWDGAAEGGRRVATGVYFYRLESPSQTVSRKLVVVR